MKKILSLLSVLFLTFGCYDDGSQTISKGPITLSLGEVTSTTATFTARLDVDMMADYQEVGLVYSKDDDMSCASDAVTKVKISDAKFSKTISGLNYNTTYYYTTYLTTVPFKLINTE